MKLTHKIILAVPELFMMTSSRINAAPSTIIWIPSVDFQGYKSFHLELVYDAIEY